MTEKLREKTVRIPGLTVQNHDDLHRWVDVAQIENCFRDVDQQAPRDQHGPIERFTVSSLKRGPAVLYRDGLAPGGAQALFENRLVVGSNQDDLAKLRYSLGVG